MTDVQRQYTKLFTSVYLVCEDHRQAWESFPPFADAYALFVLLKEKVDKGMIAWAMSQPYTSPKKQLREGLVTDGEKLAIALRAIATLGNDDKLLFAVRGISKRQLARLTEDAFVGVLKALHDRALAHTAALEPLGIDDDWLQDLAVRNAQFAASIGQPQAAIQDAKKERQAFARAIRDTRIFLNEKLDIIAAPLQYMKPDFYAVYTAARRLGKVPHRALALRLRVVDKAGKPVVGAVLRIPAVRLKKKLRNSGELRLRHLKEGEHEAVVSAEGYEDAAVMVYRNAGNRTELRVVMTRATVGVE